MGKRSRRREVANFGERIKPLRLVPPEHEALHQVAPFGEPSDQTEKLARQLVATAKRFHGLAVAAPQVGESVRLVACRDGLVILNPRFEPEGREKTRSREGCLSFPGRWFLVPRFDSVVVWGIDPLGGNPIERKFVKLGARMWQHEVDHLDGILIPECYPEDLS